ncbi:MAG: SGNH/GDSL hydrolase family protein [Albidovulum sp.]|uniref:SGNH/GDSL hydrolase family protein n=1 Tax=Albidovulum sp. TaxID=1872424 RepID=UPI003C957345
MRLLAVLGLLIIGGGALQLSPPPEIGDRIVPLKRQSGLTGDLRVAVFGTSLARRAEWPGRIDGRPVPCGTGIFRVTVMGKAGAGSRDGLALLHAADVADEDMAILEYAINDADLTDGISRRESRANHRHMIATLRDRNPDIAIILMATNPVRGLQRLKRPRLNTYYRDYAELADEAHASFFDGTIRWRTAGVDRIGMPDGLHPVPAVEVDLYQKDLTALLAQIAGSKCRHAER